MSTGCPHASQTLGLPPGQLSPGDRAAYEGVKAHDDRIAALGPDLAHHPGER